MKDIEGRFVDIKKEERICIDWREDTLNSPSYPWGELWKVIAIYKSMLDSSLWIRRTKTIIKKYIDERFPEWLPYHWANWYIYNADKCGHFNEIKTNPKKYGLSKEDINLFERYIAKYPNEKVNDLEWDHNEQWAIIISSPDKTVNSKWEEWESDYFVFNEWYEKSKNPEISTNIWNIWNLSPKVISRIEKNLNFVDEEHFEKTANALAPDIPVYTD